MKALIDTCIILDVLQHREPFFEDSLRVMHFASDKDFIGIITAKSITDIFYILRRSLHDENEVRRNIRKRFSKYCPKIDDILRSGGFFRLSGFFLEKSPYLNLQIEKHKDEQARLC